MGVKGGFISFLNPFLRFVFRCILKRMRPFFIHEDERLRELLLAQSFHPALCTHPSILFIQGVASEKRSPLIFMRGYLYLIKRFVRLGLLRGEKGVHLMDELGLQPCFGNGSGFWFVENAFPIRPYHIPDSNKPDGKSVVYTVLTGDYDEVQELLYKEEGVDYILFTNNPSLRCKTWEVICVQSDYEDVLLSREIKMLPHKYLGEGYETSIYIDANAVVYGEITQLTRYLSDGRALAISQHSMRKTVKEEIEACVKLGKTDGEQAWAQYATYLKEGFIDDEPLLECGLLVRRHNDQNLQSLMQVWFNEFKNGIRRDQISLRPCISRLGYKDYAVMDGSVWHNQFNRLVSHKKK